MNERITLTSLTRIADLDPETIAPLELSRSDWRSGDYVVCRVTGLPGNYAPIELVNGRLAQAARGDLIVGAFGTRHATLEVTGSWCEIGADRRMRALTGAGLLGKLTSKSPFCPNPIPLEYVGHVFVKGRKVTMSDCVVRLDPVPYATPTVALIGSSMSAGKTTVSQSVIRILKASGLRVVGAKFTGAGRYRDILSMSDAGADEIVDFVDAGIPSSVCSEEEYRMVLQQLLAHIAHLHADVAVVEMGASPLEPYNGQMAVFGLGDWLKCTILCASDPYSVVGVMDAFGVTPDIVSGVATNTRAGIELIEKLCKVSAVNVLDEGAEEALSLVLASTLGMPELAVGDSTASSQPLLPTA